MEQHETDFGTPAYTVEDMTYPPTTRISLTPSQLETILVHTMGWEHIDVTAFIKAAWALGVARN